MRSDDWKKPLFSPTEEYEKLGDVSNVVFPTGTSLFNGRLYIYYGAADKRIAVLSLELKDLLKDLIKSKSKLQVDIGFIAGDIYERAYNEEVRVADLKEEFKENVDLLMMAIGWLARENKIILRKDNGDLKIWSIN